jgi:hypothetical protein
MKFFLSLVIGGVAAVALGFSVYTIGGGTLDFLHWVNHGNLFIGGRNYDAYFWALGGIVVGGAISLLRSKNLN